MYFQFLIEDKSTEILVSHVMNKLEKQHTETPVYWKIKSFSGIGHLPKEGNVLERKTGKLLNDLAVYMRGIGKVLQEMQDAICDTWEVLADVVCPQGHAKLKKNAGNEYTETGKAKCEWADRIGKHLRLYENNSPSFQYFIGELEKRITV